jgi:hypothetical protein
MKIDLHTHTNASDGSLTPAELVEAAAREGVDVLAITDHDTVAALPEADVAAKRLGLRLIHGVEISTFWKGLSVHIAGLNIDNTHPDLLNALLHQQTARIERAKRIGQKLDKSLGKGNSFEAASANAGDSEIGRPHFAQYLVEAGFVRTQQEAFKKYLGAGKLGDIKDVWLAMEDVIRAIHKAGGVSVLAHPALYKLTHMQRKRLVADFKLAGGDALEVATVQGQELMHNMAQLCEEFDLLASQGTDYHGQSTPWITLGRLPPLPKNCKPVWGDWSIAC